MLAYFMPRQDLDPRPNGTKYFSIRFRSSGSSQRSGMKDLGSWKIVGFSWINFCVVLTAVWDMIRKISCADVFAGSLLWESDIACIVKHPVDSHVEVDLLPPLIF